MKKLGIIFLLSLIVLSLSFCRKDVNGPIDEIPDPPADRTIDWVIQNRPEDLVAVVAVFPERYPAGGIGGNFQQLALFDYYNPENYKFATDTTYRVTDPVFSNDKTKMIFGDMRRYIWDRGPGLVLYDIVQNTFEQLPDPVASTLAGMNVVWDVNDMGFYFSYEPYFVASAQSVFYFDLSSKTYTAVYHHFPMKTYPVELLPPDTLIVFTNDTSVTHQPEGYYYMTTNGQFISRINIDKLIYYREDAEYPLNLYPHVGKIKWYEDLQLFIFEEQGNFISGIYIKDRIALTSRDGTFYKYFPVNEVYFEDFIGWNSYDKKILVLLSSERPGDIGIWGSYGMKIALLDYQTGEMKEFLLPKIITSCIAFAWAVY